MLSLLVAGAGIATAAFGLSSSSKEAKKQEELARQAAAVQAQQNAIRKKQNEAQYQIKDLQYEQQIQTLTANKQKIGLESDIENVREQVLNLDYERNKRQGIRNLLTARAAAVSSAVGQGARTSDSGVLGGLSQITTNAFGGLLGLRQAQDRPGR